MSQLLTSFTRKIEDWASKKGLIYKLAESYYHDVIRREVILADIKEDDHVLCIGGGICPFSAILLHQITGAAVTVIDNNLSCVKKARSVIKRFGLKDHIKVLCQDGRSSNLSFSEYSVVHFALQVCPKDWVFSNVENHVAPGTKLLLRCSKRCSLSKHPLLHYCPCTTHSARNIGSTLLYIKQEDVYEDNAKARRHSADPPPKEPVLACGASGFDDGRGPMAV